MTEAATFRFFQISDALFDSAGALRSLELPPAKRRERTEEGFVALEKLLSTAVDEEIDAVIVAGNLYHADTVTTATISRLQTILARLRRTPIIVCPGEHDPWSADSMYNQQAVAALGLNRWSQNVYVFNKNDYSTIRLPACPNVSITCRPFVDKVAPVLDDAKLSTLKKDDSRIKILIRPLPSAHHVGAGNEEPGGLAADDVERFGFTFAVFSGRPTCRIINGSLGRPVAACAGTFFGQSELDAGRRVALDCTLHVSEYGQSSATVEQREFDKRRIVVASVDLTHVGPEQRAERFRSAISRSGARDEHDIVILKLLGMYPAGFPPEVNLDEIRRRYYHVRFQDFSRPDYLVNPSLTASTEQRFIELISELRLASSSDLARVVQSTRDVSLPDHEVRSPTVDDDFGVQSVLANRGELLDDAMYFGLEALREGRIFIRDAD